MAAPTQRPRGVRPSRHRHLPQPGQKTRRVFSCWSVSGGIGENRGRLRPASSEGGQNAPRQGCLGSRSGPGTRLSPRYHPPCAPLAPCLHPSRNTPHTQGLPLCSSSSVLPALGARGGRRRRPWPRAGHGHPASAGPGGRGRAGPPREQPLRPDVRAGRATSSPSSRRRRRVAAAVAAGADGRGRPPAGGAWSWTRSCRRRTRGR